MNNDNEPSQANIEKRVANTYNAQRIWYVPEKAPKLLTKLSRIMPVFKAELSPTPLPIVQPAQQ